MKKKLPLLIIIAVACLGLFSYLKYKNYKKEKAISDQREKIHQRAADSVDAIYQKKQDSAFNKLLSEKRPLIQEYKNREARLSEIREKDETLLLGRGESKKAKKTLGGSSFKIISDCEASESLNSDGQQKIELQINVCKEVKEFKYKVFNPNFGGDVNKVQSWYLILNVDLANIKYHSDGAQYFDIKEVMRGVLMGMKSDPATTVDFMKPVIFEGGKVMMTRLESNGKSSTLEFVVYVNQPD